MAHAGGWGAAWCEVEVLKETRTNGSNCDSLSLWPIAQGQQDAKAHEQRR